MVRNRELRKSDLVRADYSRDWRRVDEVVGLLHMARRETTKAVPGAPVKKQALSERGASPRGREARGARALGDSRGSLSDERRAQLTARLSAIIVAVGAAMMWVAAHSAHEGRRFPGFLNDNGLHVFPMVGACPALEFWFLTLDLALLAGIAGYCCERWVERRLD